MSRHVDGSCLLQYNCWNNQSVFSLIVLAGSKGSRDDSNQGSFSREIALIIGVMYEYQKSDIR